MPILRKRGHTIREFDSRRLSLLEGLSAALDELSDDETAGDSIRRVARSVRMAASATGARQLTRLAREVELSEVQELEARALDLLSVLENPALSGSSRDVNILLVEDDAEDRELLGSHLRGPTHTVHFAVDAQEAEAVLDTAPIDIIVLDLMLPDRDGRDFLAEIRERPGTASLPVIVVSGMGGSIARAECLALGADYFMAKPADREELQTTIARFVRRARVASRVDPSTGLANRAALREEFDRVQEVSTKDDTPFCLAVIDLGELLAVFDGHLMPPSDRAAISLAEGLPGGALVGRWFEEEFLVILPGLSREDASVTVAAEVRRILSAPLFLRTGLSLTYGVVQVETDVGIRDAVSNAHGTMITAEGAQRDSDSAASSEDVGSQTGLPVMLVEDDEVTARLVEHRLAREGLEVVRFRNGTEAKQALGGTQFSLAILDVQVPGTDGFEVLEALTGGPPEGRAPVIVLTAMGGEADVIRGLDLGASDYMLKPFSPTELIARVRRILRAQGR